MTHLLDVNVLLALCDPAHPFATAASRFFKSVAVPNGWATCPLVENGFLRIFGGRKYPGGQGSPQAARLVLASLLNVSGHQFWTDAITLQDRRMVPTLPASNDITDLYLLALAVKNGGRFTTFDSRIDHNLVPGGAQALLLLSP